MKTRLSLLFLVLTLTLLPARALMTYHHREHLGCSGWSDGLTAIINDAARVCGQIGPFGPTSRFHYSGDVAILNSLLEKYAAIPGQPHVLYLQPEAAPAVEDFDAKTPHDFDVSVNQAGEGYVHLYTLGRIRLEELKIPAGVSVEVVPSVSVPTDAAERAKLESEKERVTAFAAAHKGK